MLNSPLKKVSVVKILVVDDEQEVLTHLANILKRANYQVISTTKGKQAVELAINQRPDLIILDIVLPDMGGSEVAAVLKDNSSTANIPIIFLTGILSKEEENLVTKTGKYYVMAKPATSEELLKMVNIVLAG